MSDGLYPVHYRHVQRVLTRLGWASKGQNGSHEKWKKSGHPYSIIVVIHPSRPEVRVPTLKRYLTTLNLTVEEFLKLL